MMTTHTHWDASVFYSLRQHLLCVITPSPTRFTPYILSSSHLPHLHLPLCRPLAPSRSFFSLFPSHHFLSLPACLPPYLHSSLHPCLPLSSTAAAGLRCSWADTTRYLPCFSSHCSPRDDGFPVAVLLSSKTGALLSLPSSPPVAACVPSVLLAVSVC